MNLLRRSWLTAFGPSLPGAVERFLAEDPAALYAAEMWSQFTVAEVQGRVAGMVHVQGALLAAVHVDGTCRRAGIGGALMDHAEHRIAQVADHARLEVLSFNRNAITFYQRRGWVERRRFEGLECGESVVLIEMRKQVSRLRLGMEAVS